MTLSLINTIPDLVLAKNPVGIKLQTDNYIVTPAVTQVLDLIFTGGAAVNDNFTLKWANATVVFTFVTSPDSSGSQLPKYVSGDVDDWLDTVITYLNYNYYIYTDFIVSLVSGNPSGGTIRFTAKASGVDYALTVTENITNCTASNTAGADAVVNSNFSINLDVYVYSGSAWVKSGSLVLPPDANNQTVFFVEQFLKSYLPAAVPGAGEDSIQKLTDEVIQWKIVYAESYGDTVYFKKITEGSAKYAIRAGLNFTDFPGNDFFATWLPANKKFLTWSPNYKKINTTQDEYLNFLLYGSITEINLICKCWYSDGTTQTLSLLTQGTTAKYDLYRIPAGYTQLAIASNFTIPAGESVLKYDLWLTDQSDAVISEVKTFVVDQLYFKNERILIFENSMGGWDTLRCKGLSEYSVDTDSIPIEKILPDYWSLTSFDNSGRFADVNHGYIDSAVVRTGYMTLAELKWLKDLLISENVFELRTAYIPVRISKGSFKLYKDNDDLYALEFVLIDAFDQVNYSNAGLAGSGSGS